MWGCAVEWRPHLVPPPLFQLQTHGPLTTTLSPAYSYKTEYFFWEIFELLRRTVLVGWLLLIKSDKTFFRLVFALLISISSLTLLLSSYPYARPEDNLLAAGCQLTLIFCFVGAGYIRLFEAFSDYNAPDVVTAVMAFSSTTSIAMPLIILTLAMGVIMLIIILFLILKQGRQATIHLSSTAVPPELTVEAGQKWHLFL